MKKLFALLLALVLVSWSAAEDARAVEFRVGNDIFLDQEQVLSDDLYVAGGTVNVSQEVRGDLLVAGGLVTIDGNVRQDLIVAGGRVVINGNVGDDLRVIGGQVEIKQKVNGDVLVFGGNGVLEKTALVGGDVILAGGNFDLKGDVGGNVEGVVGRMTITGNVARNVDLEVSGKLILSGKARIGGDLDYRAPLASEIDSESVRGNLRYEPLEIASAWSWEKNRHLLSSGFLSYRLFLFAAYALLALLFIQISPYFFVNGILEARGNFWRSLGVGIAAVIAAAFAALLAFVSGIGFFVGITLMFSLILSVIFAQIFVGVLLGSHLLKIDKNSPKGRIFVAFLIGFFGYSLLTMIPIIGTIFALIASLAAVGVFLRHKFTVWSLLKKKKLV